MSLAALEKQFGGYFFFFVLFFSTLALTGTVRTFVPFFGKGEAKNRISDCGEPFVAARWHRLAFAVEDDAGALQCFPEEGGVVESVLDNGFDCFDCGVFRSERHAEPWFSSRVEV